MGSCRAGRKGKIGITPEINIIGIGGEAKTASSGQGIAPDTPEPLEAPVNKRKGNDRLAAGGGAAWWGLWGGGGGFAEKNSRAGRKAFSCARWPTPFLVLR